MIAITLRRIMECEPCYDPVERGVFDKDHDFDAPISFQWLAERIPPGDVIWCFSNLPAEHDSLKRHFAVDCAERVKHLMTDERSLNALFVARKHALGEAGDEELRAACDAARDARATARDAARDAAWAACDTAKGAACDTAWSACDTAWSVCDTARATAKATAKGAAWAAARGAAWAAARTAAWDAELRWQVQRIIKLTETGEWSPAGEKK